MEGDDSYNVLHTALLEENADLRIQALRHLIDAGEDVNSCSEGTSAPMYCTLQNGDSEMIFDIKGTPVLMEAAMLGDAECVSSLLETGANVNQSAGNGQTALMSAAIFKGVECMKLLLEAGVDVNQSGRHGETALMEVVGQKRDTCESKRVVECLLLLLKAGANLNQSNENGETAILLEASYADLECMKVLLEAGAGVNQLYRSDETVLIRLVRHDRGTCVSNRAVVECVQLLLEFGTDVTQSDNDGITPLIQALRYGRDVECVKVLLETGANVNQIDNEGQTALLHCLNYYRSAYEFETNACLKLLVNAGANIDAQSNRNLQPIHYALGVLVCCQHLKFPVEYLISENCNLSHVSINKVKSTIDGALSAVERPDIVKLLFNCGLPRPLCQSFIVQNETSIRKWIEDVASQPKTLASLCVFEIRRTLGHGIKYKVPKLDLTSVCQDLILLKGFLSSECFT